MPAAAAQRPTPCVSGGGTGACWHSAAARVQPALRDVLQECRPCSQAQDAQGSSQNGLLCSASPPPGRYKASG